METKIRKIGLAFIILLVLMNQVGAQWEKTNFPEFIQVNCLAIKDSLIFAGTEGYGVYVSSDNGMNWKELNNGLQNKLINTILIDDSNIFVGHELGVSISTNNGNNWNTINSGLANLGVWSLAVNKDAGVSTLYAGTWNGVYSSSDNGSNWKVTGLTKTMVPVNSVLATGNLVFAATNGDAFFQSTDKGKTWMDKSFLAVDIKYNPISGTPIGNDKIGVKPTYALTKMNSNIVVSVGNGYTCYKPINANSFSSQTNTNIASNALISFASRGNTLYCASVAGEILFSVNDGATWKIFSPNLTYTSLCSIGINVSYMFAGMERGIKRLYLPYTNQEITRENEIPAQCNLSQNYPNPFNPETVISYQLSEDSHVSLKVYDLLGREIATLVDEEKSAGVYNSHFSILNLPAGRQGSQLSSGIYFYTLRTNRSVITKKMLLTK